MTLPDFRAVSLDEAIAKGDEMLGDHRLSLWVAETNQQREADQHAFEAASPQLFGITLVPGVSLTHVTIKPRYGSRRRRLNCLFVRQQINRGSWDGASHQFVFRIHGSNQNGWAKVENFDVSSIVGIEPVQTPGWILDKEKYLKERGW